MGNLSRRRTIKILGAAAGLPLLGGAASVPAGNNVPLTAWSGQALGARSKIILAHPDEARLRKVLGAVLNEIDRLENIFSLFVETSEISRLNRNGTLKNPSLDLRLVLREAARVSDLTGGAFDVTVQTLWRFLADHYNSQTGFPSDAEIANALAQIDYRQLHIADHEVAFAKPGMSLTLNGIAQGYITDRAADILRNEGFDHTLVQLGETLALKPKQGAHPWRVALAGEHIADEGSTIDLVDRAVATSAPASLPFDSEGRFTHILSLHGKTLVDPAESVSVVAKEAMTADALSTALTLAEPGEWPTILAASGADFAQAQMNDRSWTRINP